MYVIMVILADYIIDPGGHHSRVPGGPASEIFHFAPFNKFPPFFISNQHFLFGTIDHYNWP